MTISGFTIARNAVRYNYPFRECLAAMRPLCDELLLAYDPTPDDGTDELAKQLAEELDLKLFVSKWNMDNFKGGTELGIQTDIAMEQCKYEWNLYVQLDEAFHEDDVEKIKSFPEDLPGDVTGIDFTRAYFFGNLHTIRKDWSVPITRLTRKGTHVYSDFDGMNCKPLTGRHIDSGVWMFHYSRIGEADEISKRVRNLDGFYHPPETLIPETELPEYDFKVRKWDNYSKQENPPEVEGEFVSYMGTHPEPFAVLYQQYE